MAQAINNTTNYSWDIKDLDEVEVTKAGSITGPTITISTKGKYVDKDIVIVTPSSEVAEGAIKVNDPTVNAGSASILPKGFTAASDSTYYVELSTSAGNAKSNAEVSASGYITSGTKTTSALATSVPVSGNGSKVYIPTSNTTSQEVYADMDNDKQITIERGYADADRIITIKASGGDSSSSAIFTEGTTTITNGVASRGTYSNTAGFVTGHTNLLNVATFANTPSTDIDYIDVSNAKLGSSAGADVVPVIPSSGYLYINKGYVDNLKVSLEHLVPDDANITTATGSAEMLSGTTAYDKAGNLITGSIVTKTDSDISVSGATVTTPAGYYANEYKKSVATATVSPTATGSATIDSVTVGYNATNDNFDVTGQANVTGEAKANLSNAGYVASATSGSTTGTAKLTSTVNKIAGTIDYDSSQLSIKPTISKQDVNITGVTDAAGGDATTTAPSAGSTPYIKVQTTAKSQQTTFTPTITTEGYGTSTQNGLTAVNPTISVTASDATYIPIKTGSASVDSNQKITVTGSGPVLNTTTGKYEIAMSGSANITGTAVTGWVDTVKDTTVTASGTTVLNAATLTPTNSATESRVEVQVSGSRSDNLAIPDESNTTYYIVIKGAQTAAGSIVHESTVSEGYVGSAGLKGSATIPTNATISGNNTTIYLADTGVTTTLEAFTNGSSYDDITFLDEEPTDGTPYVDIVAISDGDTGAVFNGDTEEQHKYIAIYNGEYTITT